jgi:hypothetical protein
MNLINPNKNKQRIAKWLLWVMMLFVLHLLTACSDGQARKSKKKNYIEQDGYVHFELGGEKFKMPKGYFRGVGETQWGSLVYAKFWALLPDFEAYDKSKNHKAFVEDLGWGDKLFFRLSLRNTSRVSVPEIIKHNASVNGGKQFSGKLGKPDENIYGLDVYYANKKAPDDYLYDLNGQTVVYITCGSEEMNVPHPHCELKWDHSKTIYAEAVFSKKYLPQWQRILDEINNQIKS